MPSCGARISTRFNWSCGRRHPFLEFGDLAFGLAQVLEHVGAEILVELEDLQFRFADLAAGARDFGHVLALLAEQPRLVALQRVQPGNGHQVLGVERVDALEFLVDEFYFLVLAVLLRGQAADFLVALHNAFAQLRTLAAARAAAGLEQLLLAAHRVGDGFLGLARDEIVGKFDRIGAVALGVQARLARQIFVKLRAHHAQRRARHRIVEAHQHLPRLHLAAVMHQNFPDHAAGRMLHLLDVQFDHDGAARDHRARQFAGRGPGAEAADQQHHDGDADPVHGADGEQRVVFVEFGRPHDGDDMRPQAVEEPLEPFAERAECVFHHSPPLEASCTTFSAVAAAPGCTGRARMRCRTSSRGPKASCAPLAM